MGSVLNQMRAQLGLPLPWLSWLQDVAGAAPDGGADEWRCRFYGHRLHSAAPEIREEHRWLAAADLATVAGQLKDGEAVRQWLRMWQEQVDEEGRSVTRSFGLPTTDVEY